MSCYYPSLAVDYGIKEDGKHQIKFLPKRMTYNVRDLRLLHGQSLLLLPCGRCLGCKFDKAKDWATRCYLESLEHEENCFITLTYDEPFRPYTLMKEHLQKFIADLRNLGLKIRYFGCGEYGTSTFREHYHLILFGFCPSDMVLFKKSKDYYLYTSDFLSRVWGKGFVTVGYMNYQTAGYVARYATKKIGDDGSFIIMSLKPGIGMNWLTDENIKYIFQYDNVPGDFGDCKFAPVPRAFDKVLQLRFPEEYKNLTEERLKRAELLNVNDLNNYHVANLEELLKIRSVKADEKLKKIERM